MKRSQLIKCGGIEAFRIAMSREISEGMVIMDAEIYPDTHRPGEYYGQFLALLPGDPRIPERVL